MIKLLLRKIRHLSVDIYCWYFNKLTEFDDWCKARQTNRVVVQSDVDEN